MHTGPHTVLLLCIASSQVKDGANAYGGRAWITCLLELKGRLRTRVSDSVALHHGGLATGQDSQDGELHRHRKGVQVLVALNNGQFQPYPSFLSLPPATPYTFPSPIQFSSCFKTQITGHALMKAFSDPSFPPIPPHPPDHLGLGLVHLLCVSICRVPSCQPY